MFSTFQTTLVSDVRICGVGVHGGLPANLTLRPAPADSGVVFIRTDLAGRPSISARADTVCDTRLATVIGDGSGATVATVEHLMSALAGLGVDNVIAEIDGPETPIGDGSASDFVTAIDKAGVRDLDAPRRYLEILEPLEIAAPGKHVALVPAGSFEMSVEIIFDAAAIGRQHLALTVDPASYRTEIAAACTFGFFAEVEQLRAAGLGRGASLQNTIVVGDDGVMNPDTLRRPDDFVRHKALDAIGDLALIGHPILGRYEASCAGHALNNQLVRALLDRPTAWRLTARP